MDDYKKIPFDDPDLCVPDLDDFDQMKEFFLDCAAEIPLLPRYRRSSHDSQ